MAETMVGAALPVTGHAVPRVNAAAWCRSLVPAFGTATCSPAPHGGHRALRANLPTVK